MSTVNSFSSLKPMFKEEYPDKKKRYGKMRKALESKGRANSELEASKDPMAALKNKSYLNLKGKKGVAV